MDFKKIFLFGLLLLIAFSASSFLIWQGLNLDIKEQKKEVLGTVNPVPPPASAQKDLFLVSKVIDGDTIEVKMNEENETVRLIGVDTPETVDPRRPVGCFGKKASSETKRLIEGKEVILTKDISDRDKYNRLLRYVFLPIGNNENLFINDYLVRQGFAKVLTYPPDVKYDSRFLQAEKEARENLRGLWAECN